MKGGHGPTTSHGIRNIDNRVGGGIGNACICI